METEQHVSISENVNRAPKQPALAKSTTNHQISNNAVSTPSSATLPVSSSNLSDINTVSPHLSEDNTLNNLVQNSNDRMKITTTPTTENNNVNNLHTNITSALLPPVANSHDNSSSEDDIQPRRRSSSSKVRTNLTSTAVSIFRDNITNPPTMNTRSSDLGPACRTRSSISSTAALLARQKRELEESAAFALCNGQQVTSDGNPLPQGKMAISIVDMDGNRIEYYVRPLAPLSPIFHSFARNINRTRSEVRFLCDGVRLFNTDSPASKDMISGESIDCMWSATGGS